MSRANIEQALTGLIPTLNGPLPSELVELALSLLTRSRSVAHSLKPDEEIARPYACAQLASERLKQRLNLPTISSRPPCPPRIYKKLYNYLSSALPAPETFREPQTPRKSTTSAPTSARNTPGTAHGERKTPRGVRKGEANEEIPEWVMSAIRTLLKAFDYPSAAPHIYVGVESVLPLLARMCAAAPDTPSKRPRRASTAPQTSSTNITDTRILGLIAVIFLYVFARMKDEEVSPEQYKQWRETAVNTLLELPVSKDTTDEELLLEAEQLMPVAQEEGWLQMEWFTNVTPHGDGDEMEGIEMTGRTQSTKERNKGLKSGGSDYIGLGTMMQEANDYLSEQQREDYKQWKAKIMAHVQAIEAA